MNKDTESFLLTLVADHFAVDNVNETDQLEADLGGDALDVIELVMLLEEKLGITISDDQADSIVTVLDIFNVVAETNGSVEA